MRQCCTATDWIDRVVEKRPYQSVDNLITQAGEIWATMHEDDLIQAFEGHPKIGDPASLKEKFRATLNVATNEQSGVNQADEQVLEQLAKFNQAYLEKFGFIYIICASEKSAEYMLSNIRQRVENSRGAELVTAAREQWKITTIRLNNIFSQENCARSQ